MQAFGADVVSTGFAIATMSPQMTEVERAPADPVALRRHEFDEPLGCQGRQDEVLGFPAKLCRALRSSPYIFLERNWSARLRVHELHYHAGDLKICQRFVRFRQKKIAPVRNQPERKSEDLRELLHLGQVLSRTSK